MKKKTIVILVVLLVVVLACGAYLFNIYYFKDYTSSADNENTILVDNETKTLSKVSVNKTGDGENENADFSGTNAAILAQNGSKLTLKNSKVATEGRYANAVFSYDDNTVIDISNTEITTKGQYSGGIMVTGGGTLNAKNVKVETFGDSAAAIRSDRGGGTMNVEGGTFNTNGLGSPVIYSTANIKVSDAKLEAKESEAVVIERGNTVNLEKVDITGNNEVLNSDAKVNTNIMLYHSMSDNSTAYSEFTANDSKIESKTGTMFYVTNTTAKINLKNDELILDKNNKLLTIEKGPWGKEGSNGGKVVLSINSQNLEGDISVDEDSALNFIISKDSTYTGKIEAKNKTYVKLSNGAKWTLTGDSSISSLTCSDGAIDLNGHKLLVNGKEYTGGDSKGKSIEIAYSTSLDGEEPIGTERTKDGGEADGDGKDDNPPGSPDEVKGDNPPEPPKDKDGRPEPPPDGYKHGEKSN